MDGSRAHGNGFWAPSQRMVLSEDRPVSGPGKSLTVAQSAGTIGISSGSTELSPLVENLPLAVPVEADRIPGSGCALLFVRNTHTVVPPNVDMPQRECGFTSALHRHTVDVAAAPGAQPQTRGHGVPGGPNAQELRVVFSKDAAPRRSHHGPQLQAPLRQHQMRTLVQLQRQQEQQERLRAGPQSGLQDIMEDNEDAAEEDLPRAGWSGRDEWQGRYQQWMGQKDAVFRQDSCHSSDGSAAVRAPVRAPCGVVVAGAGIGAEGGIRRLGSRSGDVCGPSSASRLHSGLRRDPRRAHFADASSSPVPGSSLSGGGSITCPVMAREHRVHEQVEHQHQQRHGHSQGQKQVGEGLSTHLSALQNSWSAPPLQPLAAMGAVAGFPDPPDLPQHEELQQDAPSVLLADQRGAALFHEPPLPEGWPWRHRREPARLSDGVHRCTLDSHGVPQAFQDMGSGIESGGHRGPGEVIPSQGPLPFLLMHGWQAAPAELLPCGYGGGDEGQGPEHDGDGVAQGATTAARLPLGVGPPEADPDGGARDATRGWDGHVQGFDLARKLPFGRPPAHEWPTGRHQLAGRPPCGTGSHRRPQRLRRMSDLLFLPEVRLERRTMSKSVADTEDQNAPERRDNRPEEKAAEAGQGPHAPASAAALALADTLQRAAQRRTHCAIVQKGCNQVKVSIPAARLLFPDILLKLSSGPGLPIELYLATPQSLRRAGPVDEVEGGDGGPELQRLRGIRLVGCGLAWALTGSRGMVRALGLGNGEKALLTAMPPPPQRRQDGSGHSGQKDLPGIIVSRVNCPVDMAAETEDGARSAMFVRNFNGLLTVPATLAESLFPPVATLGREATLLVRAFARLPGEAELRLFPGVCLRSLFRKMVVSGLSPTLQALGVQVGEVLALQKDSRGRIVLSVPEDAVTAGTRRRGRGDDSHAIEARDVKPRPAKRCRRGRRAFEPDVSDFDDDDAIISRDACAVGRDEHKGNQQGAAMEVDGGSVGEGGELKQTAVYSARPRCTGPVFPGSLEQSSCAGERMGEHPSPRAMDQATGCGIAQPAQIVSTLAAAVAAALPAMPSLRLPVGTKATEEAGTGAAAEAAGRDAGHERPQEAHLGEGCGAGAERGGPLEAASAHARAEGLRPEGSDAQVTSIIEIPSERLVFLDGRGRRAASAPWDRALSGLSADDIRQRVALGPDPRADGGDEYGRGYYDGYQDGYVNGIEDLADVNDRSGRRNPYHDETSRAPHALGWEQFDAERTYGRCVPGGGTAAVDSSGNSFALKYGRPGAWGASRVAESVCSGARDGGSAPTLSIRVVQLPSGRLRSRSRGDLPGADWLQPSVQQQRQPQGPPLHFSGSPSVNELEAVAWDAAEDGRGESVSAQTHLSANLARSGCTAAPRPVPEPRDAQPAAAVTQNADANDGRLPMLPHAISDGSPSRSLGGLPPRPAAAFSKAAALAEAAADVQPLDLEMLLGLRRPLAQGAGSSAALPARQWVAVPVVDRTLHLMADSLGAPHFIGRSPRQQQLREPRQLRQHPPQARGDG